MKNVSEVYEYFRLNGKRKLYCNEQDLFINYNYEIDNFKCWIEDYKDSFRLVIKIKQHVSEEDIKLFDIKENMYSYFYLYEDDKVKSIEELFVFLKIWEN